MSFTRYIKDSVEVFEKILNSNSFQEKLDQAIQTTVQALNNKKPLLVCGNGGSASDAQHITGELVGRYLKERKALNVICLSDNPAVLTALGNDYGYDVVFSRQVEAYGQNGGIIIGLSTSGNSKNVIKAFEQAKSQSMTTIAFTGQGGGALAPLTDILIDVPSRMTPLIQQAHLLTYHYYCEQIEHLISEGN